jgi:hypothetical protein
MELGGVYYVENKGKVDCLENIGSPESEEKRGFFIVL